MPLQCRATQVSQCDDTGHPSHLQMETLGFSPYRTFSHSDRRHQSRCSPYETQQRVSFLQSCHCFPSSSSGCVVLLSLLSCHDWGRRHASSHSSGHHPLILCCSSSQVRSGRRRRRRKPENRHCCCFLMG